MRGQSARRELARVRQVRGQAARGELARVRWVKGQSARGELASWVGERTVSERGVGES